MKQPIDSEDEAKAEAAYQWALYRRRMRVYLCLGCGGWRSAKQRR